MAVAIEAEGPTATFTAPFLGCVHSPLLKRHLQSSPESLPPRISLEVARPDARNMFTSTPEGFHEIVTALLARVATRMHYERQ